MPLHRNNNKNKFWTRVSCSKLVLVCLFVVLSIGSLLTLFQLAYAGDQLPPLRYSSTSNTLVIGRPYLPLLPGEAGFANNPSHPDAPKLHITLADLAVWAAEEGEPNLLRERNNGIWEIAVHIDVEDNAQLDLTAADGLNEVRLISRPDAAHNLIADGGTLNIDGIKLYSWDDTLSPPGYDLTFLSEGGPIKTRSFLAALYGGRMEINNAEIMYLGYDEPNANSDFGKGEPSGLAWRLRPVGVDNPASGAKGGVRNSIVHHNYYGMYSYEAVGLEIRDSEFHSHHLYGLDPHDYSYNLVVANNIIRDNGYTGLIFSRHCTDNEVYGNEIYRNGSHGFMLDRSSDRNLVYNNIIRDNDVDGVAIYQSSNNRIEDNTITGNGRSGVRISAEFDATDQHEELALDNTIIDNTIADNGRDGIYVVDRADRNRLLSNIVARNARSGLLLNSGLSLVQNNEFHNNGREGIRVSDEAYLSGTNEDGITSLPPVGAPATANLLLANHIHGNGDNGIVIDGGGENQLGSLGAGNVIEENRGSGIYLDRTGAILMANNEIYRNIADNGAGILSKCDAGQEGRHTILDNVITENQATDSTGRGAGIVIGAQCLAQINGNRIYANSYPNGTGNLENKNPTGSPALDATGNIWDTNAAETIEETIWHGVDDNELGLVEFLPVGDGPQALPATPVPTPTASFTATSIATTATLAPGIATPTPTVTPTPTGEVSGAEERKIYLPNVAR